MRRLEGRGWIVFEESVQANVKSFYPERGRGGMVARAVLLVWTSSAFISGFLVGWETILKRQFLTQDRDLIRV